MAADEMAADEPADHRSAPTVPAQAMPTRAEPADTEHSDTEPTDAEPADTEHSDTEPTDAEPTDAEPTDAEPTDTEPADTEPANTEPADTEPAAARPGPSEAGPADDTGRSAAASTSAGTSETTAGIPLRQPGWGGADQPETSESSLDSEPGQDDPVSDEAHPASRPGILWVPRAREEPSAEIIRDEPGAYPSKPTGPGTPAASPEASTAAPEAGDQGSAQAGPRPEGPGPAKPGRGGEALFTPALGPAAGSAGPARAEPEQPGDAPAPADQPGKPTSFLDSVFGPRTPAGSDQAVGSAAADETQPSGVREEQGEGHPATLPSEAAEGDEEPQFDRFRSSPTPPDDE
jgi:hypothetical protein